MGHRARNDVEHAFTYVGYPKIWFQRYSLSHTHCLFLSSSFVCFAIAVNSSIYGNLMNVLCLIVVVIVVVFQYTEQYSKLLCDICLEKAKKNYKVFVIEVQKI